MITPVQLRDLRNAKPFKPFRVHTVDGKLFNLTCPDMFWITAAEIQIGLDPDEDGIASRFAHYGISNVTDIEELNSEKAA